MTRNKQLPLAAVFEIYKQRQDALANQLTTIDNNIFEGMADAAYRDTDLYVASAVLSRNRVYRGCEQFEVLNQTNINKVREEYLDVDNELKKLNAIYSKLQKRYATNSDKTVIPKEVTDLIDSISQLEEKLKPYISMAEEVAFQGKLASEILPDARGPPGSWTNPTGDPYRDEISPFEIMFPPKRR